MFACGGEGEMIWGKERERDRDEASKKERRINAPHTRRI